MIPRHRAGAGPGPGVSLDLARVRLWFCCHVGLSCPQTPVKSGFPPLTDAARVSFVFCDCAGLGTVR